MDYENVSNVISLQTNSYYTEQYKHYMQQLTILLSSYKEI